MIGLDTNVLARYCFETAIQAGLTTSGGMR